MNLDCEFLYEDEDFIAVDKPSGVLTTPPRFRDDRPVLGLWLQDKVGRAIFPIHRLDYEVSGLTLFAKNAEAHRAANLWFEERDVRKTYVALTEWGEQNLKVGDSFDWIHKMVRGKKRSFVADHGLSAETHAIVDEIRESKEGIRVRWVLSPKTGRPHQLRLHLSLQGFPIIGDKLYGSTRPYGATHEIALRSMALNFEHVKDPRGLPPVIRAPLQF